MLARSPILFEEDGKAKRPVVGMYLGTGLFSKVGISFWVRSICLFEGKSCKTDSRQCGSHYKVWNCTDSKCTWGLRVCQSRKKRW